MVLPEEILKLSLAIIVGGLIGAEREFRHRAAGFRTIIFICLGSTLFTMFSLELGGETSPVRIAAHMVTGVGFLCAGVILEEEARIVGLTTASTIWFTAAMGMGIGGGLYTVVAVALIGAMVILWVFPSQPPEPVHLRMIKMHDQEAARGEVPAERVETVVLVSRGDDVLEGMPRTSGATSRAVRTRVLKRSLTLARDSAIMTQVAQFTIASQIQRRSTHRPVKLDFDSQYRASRPPTAKRGDPYAPIFRRACTPSLACSPVTAPQCQPNSQ